MRYPDLTAIESRDDFLKDDNSYVDKQGVLTIPIKEAWKFKMAIIDYGCLMFKNGKLISNGMFTPMKDTCGFVDEEFEHQYFGVCGDEEFFVGFYKHQIAYKRNGKTDYIWVNCPEHDGPAFISYKWREMKILPIGNQTPLLIITKRNGFYVCKFEYKGDKYKIFFGYGVDYDWYKKTHLVNYYRTNPIFLWCSFYRKIKWGIQDWRMRR